MGERSGAKRRPKSRSKVGTAAWGRSGSGHSGHPLIQLRGRAGNRAIAEYLVQRQPGSGKKPAKTMDFSDQPAKVVGHRVEISAGGPPVAARDIARLHRNVAIDLGRNANAAIKQFTDFMSFAADEEASVDGVNAAFTFARKALVDHYVGKALGPLVELVPVVGQAKGLVDALVAESERANQASGSVRVRKYLVDLSASWNTKVDKLSKGLDGLGDRIEKQYAVIASTGGERPTGRAARGGRTVVTGPGAEFLSTLKRQAEQARKSQPTSSSLLRQMVVNYATSQEGKTVSLGGGEIKTSGKIYITGRLTIEGDSISVQSPSSARLLAPSAAKTASALNRVMSTEGWTVHDLPIEKRMTVKVEHEIPWSNDYYTAHLRWTGPGSLRLRVIGNLHNEHGQRVSPEIRDRILTAWKARKLGTARIATLSSK